MSRRFSVDTARGKVSFSVDNSYDEDLEYAYTNGQCIALSLALHRLTGWPIVAHLTKMGDMAWWARTHGRHIAPDEATDGWFYHFVHSLVATPDGFLLDVRAEHDPEAYLDEASYTYGNCALVTVDPDTLLAALADVRANGAVYFDQDAEAATAVAEMLLAEYETSRAT